MEAGFRGSVIERDHGYCTDRCHRYLGYSSAFDCESLQALLAEKVDITLANLSILKTGKAKAIRFSTLAAICEALHCQPGDLLEFAPDGAEDDGKVRLRLARA